MSIDSYDYYVSNSGARVSMYMPITMVGIYLSKIRYGIYYVSMVRMSMVSTVSTVMMTMYLLMCLYSIYYLFTWGFSFHKVALKYQYHPITIPQHHATTILYQYPSTQGNCPASILYFLLAYICCINQMSRPVD